MLVRVALALATVTLVTGLFAETGDEFVPIRLPPGDAAKGRQAFLDLSCVSCHRVSGEIEFPGPVSANPGPTLDAVQALQPAWQVANSIIQPSHMIFEPVGREREDELSPMGDYTEAMTVRQLIDLLAYIRSLE